MRVALGGPMASGKSTVGRALAARQGVPFLDLDATLGDIPSLFAEIGEAGFRDRESASLAIAVAGTGVIALGGGTLEREANRQQLEGWTVVILMATRETLRQRLQDPIGRPLAPSWERTLDERAPIWAAYGAPVWTDPQSVETTVDQVLERC